MAKEMLTILLRDEWLAYETRELSRLFLDPSQTRILIDLESSTQPPVPMPGIVCDCARDDQRDHCQVQLITGKGKTTVDIPLPRDWYDSPLLRREVKRRYKTALYDLLQSLFPSLLPWGILTGVRPVKLAHQLLKQDDNPSYINRKLEKDYRVSPEKAALLTGIAQGQAPILNAVKPHHLSLYIGVPLCPSRCSYCSFISQAVKSPDDPLIGQYLEALLIELQGALTYVKDQGKAIDTLYIGGGTPSVLSASMIDRLFSTLASHNDLGKIREITFEAGRPDTLDREKLQVLRQYPANRLSINPQTLQPETLKRINRCHTVEEFHQAWHLAREMGFDTLNLDLILGLPGEEETQVIKTLQAVAPLKPDNLTLHALAIKRSSTLKTEAEGRTMDDPSAQSLMKGVYEFAREQNLRPYYLYRQKEMTGHLENVGFSLPGKEGRYNILMMEEKQTILGIGAGAVSKLYYPETDRIERLPQVKDVALYLQRMKEEGFARQVWENAFNDK